MHSIGRKFIHLVKALCAVGVLATQAGAAISVGPSGSGQLTFDTAPTGTDFLTAYFNGGNISTTAEADGAIATVPASAFTAAFVLQTASTVPPNPYAYGFRHNTTGHFIQSRVTTSNAPSVNASAGILLLATIQNDTGGPVSTLNVGYDMGVTDPAVGELPGHRVYFNVTGAVGNWQVIPEFSGIETNGHLSASLNVGSWASGATMYLLWFDDNANGVTDPGYTIDNLEFSPPMSVPIALVSSPTNVVVNEGQPLTLRAGVTGSALQFQWYHNNVPMTDISFCTNGHNRIISGAAGPNGANLTFSSVEPDDAGQYRCIISNFSGSVTTLTATVTVNRDLTPPRVLLALLGQGSTNINLYLSEPLNDSCVPTANGGVVTDLSTWLIEELVPGQDPHFLGLDSFTNFPSVTGSKVIGLNTSTTPFDPGHLIRITLQADLADTSVAQNVLPYGTVIYVGTSTNQIFSFNHSWRYNDQDVDPGPNWFASEPAGYQTGPGPFDAKRDGGIVGPDGLDDCRATTLYGLGTVGTCLRLQSPVTHTNVVTVNFWTQFNLAADPAQTILRWEGKMDDGAVIYLNGQELQRLRMPAAPTVITRATVAPAGVADADPQDAFEFLAPASLRSGNNLLAVELHQGGATSTDLTMGMRLLAITPPTPRLSISYSAGFVTINWQPAVGELQYSSSLAPAQWFPVTGAISGFTEAATGLRRFYRVVLP
ncbi:MAG: hypothetical protein QOF48_47 [Verrucomicrobiota bacterium]|jgi:hypothetical protein